MSYPRGLALIVLFLASVLALSACDASAPEASDPDEPDVQTPQHPFSAEVLGAWVPVRVGTDGYRCLTDPDYSTSRPQMTDVLEFYHEDGEAYLDVHYVSPSDIENPPDNPIIGRVVLSDGGLYFFEKVNDNYQDFFTPVAVAQDTLNLNFGTTAHRFALVSGQKVRAVRFKECTGQDFVRPAR